METMILYLIGTAVHFFKKYMEMKKADPNFDLKSYITHYPYRSFMNLAGVVSAYFGLPAGTEGVTAFLAGYAVDSASNAVFKPKSTK